MSNEPGMPHRLGAALRESERDWTLCLSGEDQADKLSQLAADLRLPRSPDGTGKKLPCGFAYWGVEPAVAWSLAVNDPMNQVMKKSIESFVPSWNQIFDGISDGPVHYVSLGPGTGSKDHAILRSLRDTGGVLSYIPVDISAQMLRMAVHDPMRDRTIPRDRVIPIQLDFVYRNNMSEFKELLSRLVGDEPVLVSLLGNTLANVEDDKAFVSDLGELVRPQDQLVVEVATTGSLSGELAELAAQEYRDSHAFRTFVSSTLIHYTDIPFDAESVEFDGYVDDDRALFVKMYYRNKTDDTQRFRLPDRSIVSFPPGDTIRLAISRKYLRDRLGDLLSAAKLRQVEWTASDFVNHRASQPFAMDLLLLKRDADGGSNNGVANALWKPQ